MLVQNFGGLKTIFLAASVVGLFHYGLIAEKKSVYESFNVALYGGWGALLSGFITSLYSPQQTNESSSNSFKGHTPS